MPGHGKKSDHFYKVYDFYVDAAHLHNPSESGYDPNEPRKTWVAFTGVNDTSPMQTEAWENRIPKLNTNANNQLEGAGLAICDIEVVKFIVQGELPDDEIVIEVFSKHYDTPGDGSVQSNLLATDLRGTTGPFEISSTISIPVVCPMQDVSVIRAGSVWGIRITGYKSGVPGDPQFTNNPPNLRLSLLTKQFPIE